MVKARTLSNLRAASWRTGRRVSQVIDDTQEVGTILAANGEIKVKWDSGRTSYYRRSVPANLRLQDIT
jgi:hypothetical protein